MKRSILVLLALNFIGFGVYFYANMGTFVFAGYYKNFPIYVWHPTGIAVIVSLLSILFGGIVYYFSINPTKIKYRVSYILSILTLYIPLIITRVISKSFNLINLQRTPIGTDSVVLQYEAAKSIVHLHNPYAVDYIQALLRKVSWSAYTWVYNGSTYTPDHIIGFVSRFDYLPQAALYYFIPALFGINPTLWNVSMMVVFAVILFVRIEEPYKGLYIALLVSGMLIYFFEPVRMTPDSGWLVPLLIAVMIPKHPRLSGFLIGFAIAYRPYVALFAILYFIALYNEGYDWKTTILWALIPNALIILPFFLANPSLFIENIFIPYTSNFSPYDSIAPGIIAFHFLGVDLNPEFLKMLVGILTTLSVALAWKKYKMFKWGIFVFPTIIMLFYPRPSYVYYIYFPFIAYVMYITGFFEGSYSPHSTLKGMINSFTENIENRYYNIREDHAKLSSAMLGTSIVGLLLLLDFAYEFTYIRVIATSILLVLPILMYHVAAKGHKGTKYIIIGVVSLLLIGGFIISSEGKVYYIVHDYKYQQDFYWLTVYAAEDILSGKNPYFSDYFDKLSKEKYFGKNIEILPESHDAVVPEKINFRFPCGEGYTEYIENGKVKRVTFYDYPPILAVLVAISILLGMSPAGFQYLLLILSILVLMYRIKSEIGRTVIATVLLGSYTLATFSYSVFSNSIGYVAFLILMMAYLDKPKISGVFAGLAVMTMPQAGLFVLIWLAFLLSGIKPKKLLKLKWIRQFLLTLSITIIAIFIPFGLKNPIDVIQKMFFPIIGNLINNEHTGIGIANLLTINYGLPSRPFTIAGIIVGIAIIVFVFLKGRKFGEISLVFTVYIFAFFPRTIISYVSFYFLLGFIMWSIRHFSNLEFPLTAKTVLDE